MSFWESKKVIRRVTEHSSLPPLAETPDHEHYSGKSHPDLFTYLSKSLNPKNMKKQILYKNAWNLFKKETGASYVEIFLLKKNKLVLCTDKIKPIKVNFNPDENILAFCVATKEKIVVTNPHTSSLFKKFKDTSNGFAPFGKTTLKVTSFACVPLFNVKGKVTGCVQLFNKLDQNKCQSFFSDFDVELIVSIGKYVSELLESHAAFRHLSKKHKKTERIMDDQTTLMSMSNSLGKRGKLLEKLVKCLDEQPYFCEDLLQLMKEVMDCITVSVFFCHDNAAELQIFVGNNEAEGVLKLVEYSCFVIQKVLNVKNLLMEPLFCGDMSVGTRSCLIVPIRIASGQQFGICYIREQKVFSNLDMQYSEKITEKLLNYTEMFHLSTNKNKIQNFQQDFINMTKFSIPVNNSLFDFYQFFSAVKTILIDSLALNSCSIYVADQITDQLWTRNSNSSSSLFFPYSSNTLIGYCYQNKQVIFLPSLVSDYISDLSTFQGKKVLAVPILSNNFENPSLGVIIAIRTASNFTDIDLTLISHYANITARILENVYVMNLDKADSQQLISPNMLKGLTSPKNLFREINFKNAEKRFLVDGELESMPQAVCDILEFCTRSSKVVDSFKGLVQKIIRQQSPRMFYSELPLIVNCEKASILMIQDVHFTLLNLETKELIMPTEQMSNCLIKKESLYLDLTNTPNFSASFSNNQGLISLKNLLIVPILKKSSSVLGLILMSNFSSPLTPSSIQDLSLLGSIAGLLFSNSESRLWQHINESTNINFKFQQWSRIIYEVGKNCLSNLILRKTSILKLNPSNKIEDTLKVMMTVIACIMNCTECILQIATEDYSFRVTTSEFIPQLPVKTLMKIQSETKNKTSKKFKHERYVFRIPIRCKSVKGMLTVKHSGKKTGNEFVNDTTAVVAGIKEICLELAAGCYSFPDVSEETRCKVIDLLKLLALNYQPVSFYMCVQKATKLLLDCENAIFVIKAEKKLIVPEQKCELDIPADYVLEEEEGLMNSVLRSKNSEIVQNAYEDSRFETKLDKLTGYRTSNLLCTPLIYNSIEIGGIQAMNKRIGEFTQNDLSIMKSLSESVCMTLDLIRSVHFTLEERERFISITNSMGKHVLVFNEEGFLIHSNKPTDLIFNTPFKTLQKTKYNSSLPYPDLIADLTSVLENPETIIQRYSQKFKDFHSQTCKQVNYFISQINYFSLDCVFGVILIIEDCALLENLYKEFKSSHETVRNIISPISRETKLQSSIEELQLIKFNIEKPELRSRLDSIIISLQDRNLTTPRIVINKADETMNAIASLLELPDRVVHNNQIAAFNNLSVLVDIDSTVSLDKLRNWDLNPFQIENHFDYIVATLKDFDVISSFQVDFGRLMNFLAKVKEGYLTWKNPFHNFMHGFNVMHGVYMLLSSTAAGTIFESHQIFALLIAGLCHDLDHRGRNNVFEVNKRTVVANTHSDKSVLERHHAAMTFFIINEENSNIFDSVSNEMYVAIRKLMIFAILSTDMTKHLRVIEESKNRFMELETKKMGTDQNDVEKLAGLLTHCGDLFHPCKSYDVYQVWSILVCQEFTDQYNEEVKLGLPVTTFMKDLDKPLVYYSNEIGFLGYIVKPLWECLQLFLTPEIDKLVENINKNIEIMKNKKEDWIKAEVQSKLQ